MPNISYKLIKTVYSCLFFLFACLIFLAPNQQVNHTLIVSLLPCAGACFILLKKGLPDLRKPAAGISALLLTGIFLFMLSVREIIRSPLFSSRLPFMALYLIYLTGSTFLVIYTLLVHFAYHSGGDSDGTVSCGKKDRRIYRLIPFYAAAAVLFLMANWPFRPSPDAMTVYSCIAGGFWSDWHPIGYVTFVRLCMLLASPVAFHPFSVCIIQTVLWLLLFHMAGDILYRCTGSARAVNFYRILNLVIFVPLMYLGVMYKDVVYSMCVLGFCAELYLFFFKRKIERKDFILITLFSIGISIFRHMGLVVPVFTLLVLAAWSYFQKNGQWKKPVVSAVLSFLAFFLVSHVYGAGILHMEKNPDYIKYTVPLYVTGCLANGHPELFTEDDRQVMEKLMSYEDWVASYNIDTYWADPLSRGGRVIGDRINQVDDAYGREILKLNFRLLTRSPRAWVSAVLRITSIVWQITRPADGYEWTVAGYYVPADHPELVQWNLVTTDKAITNHLGELQYYLEKQPLLSFLYYRGGIWVFILLFLGTVLLLRKRAEFLICLLPPAIITAMLMISCPSQDPRFVLPSLETAMFFLPAILYGAHARTSPRQEALAAQTAPDDF